jgi:competence ComEA-like helix-hairpin-helix protein
MTDARQSRIQSFAFVISVWMCVLFCVCLAVFSSSQPDESRVVKLDDRINPNDASVPSLVRLPGIGLGRARAIVGYRESFSDKGDCRAAFRGCEDLQKVKGIGPKTAQDIGQWLKFE